MPKQMKEERTAYIGSGQDYSPADLIKVAEEMQKAGHQHIVLTIEHDFGCASIRCYAYRLETDSEEQMRVQKETEQDRKIEAYERATYERLRAKFDKTL